MDIREYEESCRHVVAGAAWLANSLLPELLGRNEVSKEILRSIVAPGLTLLATAACVALVLYREEKIRPKSTP